MHCRSRSPADTAATARALARAIDPGGLVVALVGPLGAGKTVFVRGLAQGLGIDPARVTSPTFVIAAHHEAASPARHLVHADFYRVESEGELEAAGWLDWIAPGTVVAAEWGDRFPAAFPADSIEVRIARPAPAFGSEPETGADERRIEITPRGPRSRATLARMLRPEPAGGGAVSLVVQKFGGTSVGSVERIRGVAERVAETARAGNQVAVIVSAMAGETDLLVRLAREVAGEAPDPREYDALVSTGEQKTTALLAMALHRLGQPARSLSAAQMGMRTDAAHTRARIEHVETERIRRVLDSGAVAVLAGFQGVDEEGNVTTLGRGGSDTSAVAVAAALRADVCEIYTDVDGVFTTDPNLVPAARKLARVSFEEMLEMASLGAKVLQIRSVQFAMRYGIPIHVRSSFHRGEGTWVTREEDVMEEVVVSGVTCNRGEAKIRLRGVQDQPGVAARVFSPLSKAGIVVDVIVQNASQDGTTDVTFTVPRSDYARALDITRGTAKELGTVAVEGDAEIAKVSVVGLGMKDHAGVASRMFQVLADEGINIQMITTSEIKISVVIEEKHVERAVRALHAAFVEESDAPAQE